MEVESYIKAVFPRSAEVEHALANMSINDRNDDRSEDDDDNFTPVYLTPRYSAPSPPAIGNKLVQRESFDLVNALTRSIQAQGPIEIRHKDANKSRGKITDISCIRSKQSNAADSPIVVVAYASGQVDICILCGGDDVRIIDIYFAE